jgi:thymidine kinase
MFGRLEIYFGPMCSGKSTELIRIRNKYVAINKKVMAVTYYKDIRYGKNVISSHDRVQVTAIPIQHLADITKSYLDKYRECDLLIIEEGQFFDDLLDFVTNAVNNDGKFVVVGGLISDFKMDKFGSIGELMRYADEVVHLTAFCKKCNDGTIAPFTKRVCGNTDDQELIGVDEYISVCRRHFYE